ncbi:MULTISPECIES: TetR/AcrR family transcriptional regulator [Sphingobacteriaceae]|uniref:Transcriptional regulator, TetR family n=1 Tax=Sphingobacterium sp. (strain 21) TaxID=743722 RepID=F4C4D1_SPHS2
MIYNKNIRERIIDTAVERFNHYGVAKTTMAEIIQTVGISSATMTLYFSNKIELIAEIVKHTLQEEREQINRLIPKGMRVLPSIYKLLEIRERTRGKYNHTQLIYGYDGVYSGLPESVLTMIKSADVKQLTLILRRGLRSGELKDFPLQSIATLYAELLYGLNLGANARVCRMTLSDCYSPEEIVEKQKEISKIFINGLRQPVNNFSLT